MQPNQSVELWVLDEAWAECLTLIETGGKHRLLRARYHLGDPPMLDKAEVSVCSATDFLQILSASIEGARRESQRYEILAPAPV